MKPLRKYILLLAALEILILITGAILTSNTNTELHFAGILYLSVSFALVTLMVIIIFFSGRKREPAARTMQLLVSVSLKFLAELIIALIWFFIAEKTGVPSVILFFVLYLTFTLFSVLVVLKTLKYKPL